MVIFDAGGVLHENNSAVSEDLMKELGIDNRVVSEIWAEEIPLLGSGKISEDVFWQLVSEKHNLRKVKSDENLLGRAFTERLTAFGGVFMIRKKLADLGIRTAVLSNTIEPHARVVKEAGLFDGFDRVLLSHEIGLRKPDPDIYKYALTELGVGPESTIFIDDAWENIKSAQGLGIQGVVFLSPYQLTDDLKKLISGF